MNILLYPFTLFCGFIVVYQPREIIESKMLLWLFVVRLELFVGRSIESYNNYKGIFELLRVMVAFGISYHDVRLISRCSIDEESWNCIVRYLCNRYFRWRIILVLFLE